MRNFKLKATLKTVLSDWSDKPNQGKCQFLVVDLVFFINTVVFYLIGKGLKEREAGNLQNLLAFSKSSPSLFVTSFSPRKTVSKPDCLCMIYVKKP